MLRTSPERLRAWVERLAVPRHFYMNARSNAWVGSVLAETLFDCGFAVHLQGEYRNVVALPRGDSQRPLVLITAHYDSVPHCPGADDNASALAVLLECARILGAERPHLDVGFVAFNAEEDGMLGSQEFVLGLKAAGGKALPRPLRNVHVLEMVGFRGPVGGTQALPLPLMPARYKVPDFLGLVGKGRGNDSLDVALRCIAAPPLRLLTLKTWGPLHKLLPDLQRSDHFPFWLADLAAVLWTDTANFRNPNYHQRSDTPDTLDYTFMQEVTELLLEVVRKEAT